MKDTGVFVPVTIIDGGYLTISAGPAAQNVFVTNWPPHQGYAPTPIYAPAESHDDWLYFIVALVLVFALSRGR